MATWAKIKIFYKTIFDATDFSLEATSTESTNNYDVNNLYDFLEGTFWQAEDSGLADPQYITFTSNYRVLNFDFETLGAGGDDVFADWFEDKTDGSIIADTVAVHTGTYACKLISGVGIDSRVLQRIAVTEGEEMKLEFWTRGDGTYAGRYSVQDVDNVQDIVAIKTTGVTAATYTYVSETFTVPAGCTEIRLNLWCADNDTSQIHFDHVRLASLYKADYLAISGHNFRTVEANLTLQYSATGAWVGEEVDAFTEFLPADNKAFIKEFTAPTTGVKYWRLKISGHTNIVPNVPYMAICVWGLSTELEFASSSFDPYAQSAKANVNVSETGILQGIHKKYTERSMSLFFKNKNSAFYDIINEWWEHRGLQNFFIAWELANNPTKVFLMRSQAEFKNPLVGRGDNSRRDITLSLIGRKE